VAHLERVGGHSIGDAIEQARRLARGEHPGKMVRPPRRRDQVGRILGDLAVLALAREEGPQGVQLARRGTRRGALLREAGDVAAHRLGAHLLRCQPLSHRPVGELTQIGHVGPAGARCRVAPAQVLVEQPDGLLPYPRQRAPTPARCLRCPVHAVDWFATSAAPPAFASVGARRHRDPGRADSGGIQGPMSAMSAPAAPCITMVIHRRVWSTFTVMSASPPIARSTRIPAGENAAYGPVGRSAWLDVYWRPNQRWVQVDGDAVNVIEVGEGPPVVFVHGLSGSWPNWLEQLPVLAAEHRVRAIDLPGFGSSPMPAGEISISGYARLLDRLLGQLGIDAAALVGNSMGGFIAAELAIAFPQRVERLVLISAAGISTHGDPRTERA